MENENTRFEHTCPRCQCHQFSHQTDPANGQAFDVCYQCHFVPGQPVSDLDKLIGQLWNYKSQTGNLSTEDIRAFQSELTSPPETEEVKTEDPDEFEARQERSARIYEAMGDTASTAADHPTFDLPAETFGPPNAEPFPAPNPAAYEPGGASIDPPTFESMDSFAGPIPRMGPPDPEAESDPYEGNYGFLNPTFRPSHPFLAPGTRPPIGFLEPQFKPDPNCEPGFGPDFGPSH